MRATAEPPPLILHHAICSLAVSNHLSPHSRHPCRNNAPTATGGDQSAAADERHNRLGPIGQINDPVMLVRALGGSPAAAKLVRRHIQPGFKQKLRLAYLLVANQSDAAEIGQLIALQPQLLVQLPAQAGKRIHRPIRRPIALFQRPAERMNVIRMVGDTGGSATVADQAVAGDQGRGRAHRVGESFPAEFGDSMMVEQIRADEIAIAGRPDGQLENFASPCRRQPDRMLHVPQQAAVEQQTPGLLCQSRLPVPFRCDQLVQERRARPRFGREDRLNSLCFKATVQ